MNKIEWENYQDGDSTPLNAENLNLMQDNIEEALELKADKKDYVQINDEYQSVGIGMIPKQEDNSLTVAGNVYANNVGVEILQLAIERNEVLGSSSRTVDTWTEDAKIGNKLTATSTGVIIGGGVSMIKVSAYVAYRHLPSSEITTPCLLLEKNGNLYRRYSYNKVDASLQSVAMIIPRVIMPATEGDVIGLSVEADSTSRYDGGTYLTVEVIE